MKITNPVLIGWIVAALCGPVRAQSKDDALSARVDQVVRAQMAEQKIPGVSLGVMRDGRIVKATGYGLANLELNVPVTPESVFHTESMGKVFTAVGVMMLVEEGKIGLYDKITKYLSATPASWKEVTIRHLLTHTSGIPDYLGNDGVADIGVINLRQDYTEDELVAKFATLPMDFQPGEKRNYSNSGYVVLGVVIHRVTGQFWPDFLQQRIFGPLGMNSTRLISEADIIPNRVGGYRLENGQWKNPPWMAPSLNTTADGTLYTNILDMAKWDAALYTEKLLKRSSLEQMWSPVKLNNGKLYPEGFGWILSEVNGHRLVWKDGANDPFTTVMCRYRDDHLTVVVLTNLGGDGSVPKRIADEVAAIYLPGLNHAEDKANVHVEAPNIGARQKDVGTIEAAIDASLKALSGPVGAPRDWDRYRHLFDPTARLVSTSINDRGETVVTRWDLDSYKTDADDYLVKTGFEDRKLACVPTRFGNVAVVRCSFEGLEQTKIVERGVAMYQLYNDGERWWITSVVWDRERPGNLIPREFLPGK